MKKIGDRITYDKPKKDELFLEIKPLQDKKKQQLFSLWMLGWTACGLFVLVALFTQDFSKDEVLFMLIYLVMWLYFELKMLHAFRWQRSGVERIEIKEGKFYYLKEVGGRGIPMILAVEKLYKFKYAPETEKGLWNDINRSIWMVGGEVIDFPANGKLARLGMKLTKQEAEKVADLINKTANL